MANYHLHGAYNCIENTDYVRGSGPTVGRERKSGEFGIGLILFLGVNDIRGVDTFQPLGPPPFNI
uniref:Uncharacterized protein n=1 Tax=Bionectria ochroleuca TaxID=29856 RepID=A0A0B7KEV5_BIOOC